ncbi:MAG: NAD(P)-dependent oxidoreductase [Candidatus Paceibacterota bacterium]|jgi:D-lactate dehydrogenase
MKIVFFDVLKIEQSVFAGYLGGADVTYFEEKLNENSAEKAKDADVVCIFVTSTINKKVIDALPNLKFIATRSTGFDHIDCAYAASKGIKVSNVPAYGSHTVAEFAFTLMLSLSRNIIKANNYITESEDFNYFGEMEGFDLNGKTLGIIGTGKIGKNVVKIAEGFNMKVIAYDLHPDLAFAKENNFKNNFMYKSLAEVVSEADIITLHAPCNKEDIHLINKEKISLMKKGVYLINTARGELIDTEALVWGLKEGIIAGFGADVLEDEKPLKDGVNFLASGLATDEDKRIIGLNHELMKMPNVIITPHIAFYTREAVALIQKTTVDNIQGFLNDSPINLVK